MRSIYKAITVLTIILLSATSMQSQISQGGIPPSFNATTLAQEFDVREFPKPDMEQLIREDQENASLGYPKPDRMGVSVMVHLDPENAGTWETLPNGDRIWRLKIVVKDALALGVYFDNFSLPEGGRFFLYNEIRTHYIGAFTSFNNDPSRLFATEFIQGDAVTLEYTEPSGLIEKPVISISEVAYAYKDIAFEMAPGNRDQSWPCMINVACAEGQGWENQSKGIARILLKIGSDYYWCSGSLINNTNNDRQPYFLTAAHCGEGSSAADMNQWIFYFNYQAATCAANWGPTNNTTTGCQLKANDPTYSDAGSDFYLVKLNSTPPASYYVYYNGWNRTNTPGDSGVCLHHPAGDIKKVSTYSNPMISSTSWNGLPTHWRVIWSPTVNGLSIIQGGSSGSPVFDEGKLIMGDLSGHVGSNSCDNPAQTFFGKIWYSWDQNGYTPATRLKDWLDPGNTGITKLQGISSQILPPIVDFTSDTTHISQGEIVHFYDLTTGNPATSWEWTFEGGLPPTSSGQNPVVTYNDYGTFDVTLTVENPDGTGTEIKTDYITVDQVLAPETDFVADKVEFIEGGSVNFTDLSTNNPSSWNWSFEGGDPSASGDQNPEGIVYMTPGVYNVSLTAANIGGSDTETKEDYITVIAGTPPLADFYADKTEILAGDSVNFFDLSTGNPTQWVWTFTGGTPAGSGQQNPTNIVYNAAGTYNVQLRAKNTYGSNTMLKENYIVVGGVSVKDFNQNQGFMLYPNPTTGETFLHVDPSLQGKIEVALFNVIGDMLSEQVFENPVNRVRLDLSREANGLYFIRILSNNTIIQRKLSLVR